MLLFLLQGWGGYPPKQISHGQPRRGCAPRGGSAAGLPPVRVFCLFLCFSSLVEIHFSIPAFFWSSAPPTKKATTIDEIDVFSQTWSRRTVRITVSRAVCQVLCKVKQPPHVGGRVRKKSSPKQSSQENRFSLNVNFFLKTKKYFFRFCLFLLIFRSFLFDEKWFSCDQKIELKLKRPRLGVYNTYTPKRGMSILGRFLELLCDFRSDFRSRPKILGF